MGGVQGNLIVIVEFLCGIFLNESISALLVFVQWRQFMIRIFYCLHCSSLLWLKRHTFALMHTLALIYLWIIWNRWDLNEGWSGVKHRFGLNIPTDTSYWQNREHSVTWTWSIIMNKYVPTCFFSRLLLINELNWIVKLFKKRMN